MSSRARPVLRLPDLPAKYNDLISLIDNGTLEDPTWPYTPAEWERIRNHLSGAPDPTDLEPLLKAARRFAVYQRSSQSRKTPNPRAEMQRYESALREMELAFENLSFETRREVMRAAGELSLLGLQNPSNRVDNPYEHYRKTCALRTALFRENDLGGPPLGPPHTKLQLYLIREADRTFDRLKGGERGRPAFIAATIKPFVGAMEPKTLQGKITKARELFP
ncbi:hypothetical protein [Azospirillum formosense]|uniref:hypothetical protein n=1 Tax=Azospirillum formosense TaxID=861533 RepID=UPI00338E2052